MTMRDIQKGKLTKVQPIRCPGCGKAAVLNSEGVWSCPLVHEGKAAPHAMRLDTKTGRATRITEGPVSPKKTNGMRVGDAPTVVAVLLTEEDRCDTGITIVPGTCRYDSLPEAEAACGLTPVETACCPTDPTPTALVATLSEVSGCSGIGGTILLTYDVGNNWWQGTGPSGLSFNLELTLTCDGDFWSMGFSADMDCGSGSMTTESVTCNPLELIFTDTGDLGGCGCTAWRVTVTTP